MTAPVASDARIVEAMIDLAHCSMRHRIVVTGPHGPHQMFELLRRGYNRVATTSTCGLPCGQYDAAFIGSPLPSVKVLETTLDWLVHFLSPTGVLVLWIVATGRHNGVISCWSGIGYCPAGRSQCGYALSPCHAGLGPSDRAHVVAPWLFALCEGSGFDPLYLGLTTARGKPSNPLGILKRPPTSDEAKGRALVVNTAA